MTQTNKSDICEHVISVCTQGSMFTQVDLEVICKKCGKTFIYNEKTNTYNLKIENKPPETKEFYRLQPNTPLWLAIKDNYPALEQLREDMLQTLLTEREILREQIKKLSRYSLSGNSPYMIMESEVLRLLDRL